LSAIPQLNWPLKVQNDGVAELSDSNINRYRMRWVQNRETIWISGPFWILRSSVND
jgi:hypothetical protein